MNGPLFHLVRAADGSVPRPRLLVLLHGVGSNEKDLFGLANEFPSEFQVLSVRAPLELRPGSYAWFPVTFTPQGPVADTAAAEASRVHLAEFLRWALTAYDANPEGVLLVGFSQGAILAASLALTEPNLVCGAALMSGRILPEVVAQAASSGLQSRTSFLVVHGTGDDRLPIHHGRTSAQALRSLGIEPVYREFSMGHTITNESMAFVRDWTKGWGSGP